MTSQNAPSVQQGIRERMVRWGATARVGAQPFLELYEGAICDEATGVGGVSRGLACTLPAGHGGPQHVAEGMSAVLFVWPTTS